MNPPDRAGLLVHNVYFTLRDRTDEARARLLDACRKYLTVQPGIVFFACGTLAEELRRPVNDRDFDVGLHIIFRDRAAHDAYQVSAEHQRFLADNQATWARARVFDSVAARAPTPGD